MGIKYSHNFDPEKILREQKNKIKAVVNSAVQEEATEIKLRTSQGKSSDGAAFKAYSEGYSDLRAKFGLGTNPDLRVTGNMLEAIATKVEEDGDRILGKIILPNVPGLLPRWANIGRTGVHAAG